MQLATRNGESMKLAAGMLVSPTYGPTRNSMSGFVSQLRRRVDLRAVRSDPVAITAKSIAAYKARYSRHRWSHGCSCYSHAQMPPTNPLLRVRDALRKELRGLQRVDDMAYRVDVEANGAECLVVHVVTKREDSVDTSEKRSIERRIRASLVKILDWNVYFRWRTLEEHNAEPRVATNAGLVDQLHSVR